MYSSGYFCLFVLLQRREKGWSRVHCISNLNAALEVLQDHGLKLVNISSTDIYDGNTKLILGLIWTIALCFDGNRLVDSKTTSGLERSLLNWVAQYTTPYGLNVTNFTTSWSDGRAFLYILNKHIPNIELTGLLKLSPVERLRKTFELASQYYKIVQLLDPEDVNTKIPDKKSIYLYVMSLYHAIDQREHELGSIHDLAMHSDENQPIDSGATGSDDIDDEEIQCLNENEQEFDSEQSTSINYNLLSAKMSTNLDDISLAKSMDDLTEINPSGIKRSSTFLISTCDAKVMNIDLSIEDLSKPSEPRKSRPNSIEINSYMAAIEEVLSLLLGAEENLSNDLSPVDTLDDAKKQFQEHEDFMTRLMGYQQHVGNALDEGSRLLTESQSVPGLTTEDQNEIKKHMFLLHERWETLRKHALQVQDEIQSRLAEIQRNNIEKLRNLLTNTEDKISRMPEIDVNPDKLREQIDAHRKFEADLDNEKKIAESLDQCVVIVNDESFSDLEDKLTALSERWSHVIQWTRNRWERLQEISNNWKILSDNYFIINKWLETRESSLKMMESAEVTEYGSIMKRINDLRYCESDLDTLQKHLEKIQLIGEDLRPASDSMLEKLENLSDCCDALKQMIAVQKSRIESMGFSIPSSSNDSRLERPVSWEDFPHKLLFEVQSVRSVECLNEPVNRRSVSKPDILNELDSRIAENQMFIESINRELVDFRTGASRKTDTLDLIGAKIKKQYDQYASLKELLSKCQQEVGGSHNLDIEEGQVLDIETIYMDLIVLLEDLQEQYKMHLQKEKFYKSLTGLKLVLADSRDWFSQNATTVTKEDLLKKLEHMESLTPEIKTTNALCASTVEAGESNEWQTDFNQFFNSWTDLKNAMIRLVQDQGGFDEMNEQIRQLNDFLNDFDDMPVTFGSLEAMNKHLAELEKLKVEYNNLEVIYQSIIDNSQSNQIENLQAKWTAFPGLIRDRIIEQNAAIENLVKFNKDYDDVYDYLLRMERDIRDDIFIVTGDNDMLTCMEETYEKHAADIKNYEIHIKSLESFKEMIIKNNTTNCLLMEDKIHALNNMYKNLIDLYQRNSKKLYQTRTQATQIYESITNFDLWLSDLEMNTPKQKNSDISNSNELYQIKSRFNSLKEMCEQKTKEFKELNDAGSDLILYIDDLCQRQTPKPRCKFLAQEFTHLNARWNEITSLVYNRTAELEHISGQLGEFKMLIVSENGDLDKLEKCLRRSPENAADAEEIYEELDVSKPSVIYIKC